MCRNSRKIVFFGSVLFHFVMSFSTEHNNGVVIEVITTVNIFVFVTNRPVLHCTNHNVAKYTDLICSSVLCCIDYISKARPIHSKTGNYRSGNSANYLLDKEVSPKYMNTMSLKHK